VELTHNVPQQICDLLYQRNIQSLIVEGGAYTLQQFINAGLYDEMRILVIICKLANLWSSYTFAETHFTFVDTHFVV